MKKRLTTLAEEQGKIIANTINTAQELVDQAKATYKANKIKKPHTYEVTYTKAIEEDAVIMVRANDGNQALRRAALHCYTGSNFRNPVKTNKQYISPTLQR